MTSPDWGLLQGGNALNSFGYGVQLGQGMRERKEAREDRNALLQFRERQEQRLTRQEEAQAAQAQETDRRNDLPIMARLLQSAQDEPSYQQMIGMAQRYGIDTADAPPNFDPQWVQSTLTLAQAAQTPDGREALSAAGKQAQDAGFRPGTPEFNQAVRQIVTADLAQPYTGSQGETRLYTPDVFGGGGQVQSGPAPGTVEDGYRFKGGNPADPNSWEPVTAGGAGPGQPGFRPIGVNQQGITSTYRTPQHNREVGGVDNSYHTRRGANGEPLAVDSVPPRGMSMSAYAAKLRRENPGLDVINEGDHVHIEPKG